MLGKTKDSALYMPFLLRRLTDFDPAVKKEEFLGFITAAQLKNDVFENIQMLFNSSNHLRYADYKNYSEIEDSVLGYGINDCCGKSSSDEEIDNLVEHIKLQLKYFESRIVPDTIKVELVHAEMKNKTLIEFRISCVLQAGDISEEVVFKSKLDLESGYTEISYS